MNGLDDLHEILAYKRSIAELEAENERLRKEKASLVLGRKMDEAMLREENERLRKDLASYRKGDCRRKIDRAMASE